MFEKAKELYKDEVNEEAINEYEKYLKRFINHFNHEIRTPLNVMMGLAELIINSPGIENNFKRLAKSAVLEGEDLLSKLNKIIDVSILEGPSLKLHELINAGDFCDHIKTQFVYRHIYLEKENVKLIIHDNQEEILFYCNCKLLSKVIKNLVENSIRYTNNGYVAVGYEKIGNYICFFVNDSGIGIKENMIKRIFDKFFVCGNNNLEGLGLGLYIVQKAVRLLKGNISFESRKGKGTSVRIFLPMNII